jgi:hypothetical protein
MWHDAFWIWQKQLILIHHLRVTPPQLLLGLLLRLGLTLHSTTAAFLEAGRLLVLGHLGLQLNGRPIGLQWRNSLGLGGAHLVTHVNILLGKEV